jgi:hypothetical protein
MITVTIGMMPAGADTGTNVAGLSSGSSFPANVSQWKIQAAHVTTASRLAVEDERVVVVVLSKVQTMRQTWMEVNG